MKLLLAAAAVLLLPLAEAQAPDLLGSSVAVESAITVPSIVAGSEATTVATVAYDVSALCAAEGTVVLELTFASAAAGIEFDPPNATLTAQMPPGAHGVAGQPPFHGTAEQEVHVLVSELAAPGSHAGEFVATVHSPAGCSPLDDASGQSATASVAFTVTVLAPDGPSIQAPHPEHEEHGRAAFELFLAAGASRSSDPLNVTGTFPYHCHVHPQLKGTVVVDANGPMTAQVRVSTQGFEPAEVRLGRGGVVTWTNQDPFPHTASADELHPGSVEESGPTDEEQGDPAPAAPPSQPPRGSPGLELLGLLAALGLAARARRP